jgi:hypothetical protein
MSASYPTSIKSFSNRSAGQTIGAAHVNDLQDEVSALETGLLNGLQHGLTVATGGVTVSTGNTVLGQNLSVAGNSTIAGSLVVSSNATITGNLTVTGTLVFTVPRVRLVHSADQGVAHNTWTGLSWDTEVYDPNGMHSTSANSSRITFADSTGVYQVGASLIWNAATGGTYRRLRIQLNDSSGVTLQDMTPVNAASVGQSVTAAIRVQSTTDYVTVLVFQDSGSTGSVTNSTLSATSFWAQKVSN